MKSPKFCVGNKTHMKECVQQISTMIFHDIKKCKCYFPMSHKIVEF